jgi:hypothetical protein
LDVGEGFAEVGIGGAGGEDGVDVDAVLIPDAEIADAAAAPSRQDQSLRKLNAEIATGPGNPVPGIYENLLHFLKDETNL